MRLFFSAMMLFFAYGLFASSAPLAGGFALAPRAAASQEEKDLAFMEARSRVIHAALKYENTPYLYGGMTAGGLDCSGFICLSFKDALGVSLPRSSAGLYSWVEKIPLENAQPGDLLFFKTDNSGRITHVALYLGNRQFIHSASAGTKTGVIYSNLNESYWARTFAGAGRVFPETSTAIYPDFAPAIAGSTDGNLRQINPGGGGGIGGSPGAETASASQNKGRLILGAAIAPTWNGFLKDGEFIRGFSSQLLVAAETHSFGMKMVFGLELRPEYDGALGVFRLPITLSWGPNDQIRIFFGPVLSFGDATLSTGKGKRHYSGGTSWFGTAGLTAAPFVYRSKSGDFAPYIELAWQSYFSDNSTDNLNADFSAGFRFSTGLRWSIQVK